MATITIFFLKKILTSVISHREYFRSPKFDKNKNMKKNTENERDEFYIYPPQEDNNINTLNFNYDA